MPWQRLAVHSVDVKDEDHALRYHLGNVETRVTPHHWLANRDVHVEEEGHALRYHLGNVIAT